MFICAAALSQAAIPGRSAAYENHGLRALLRDSDAYAEKAYIAPPSQTACSFDVNPSQTPLSITWKFCLAKRLNFLNRPFSRSTLLICIAIKSNMYAKQFQAIL